MEPSTTTWQHKASQAISTLEHAKHTLLLNSGISTLTTLLAILPHGSTIVIQDDFYNGTKQLMHKIFNKRFNYWVIRQTAQLEDLKSILSTPDINVSLILLETPSNPFLSVFDIKGVSGIARTYRGDSIYPMVAVDNTLTTPIFQKPLVCGADISLQSATKFLSGHSDTMGGSISCLDDKLYDILRCAVERVGNELEEFPSQMVYEGLQTLGLRVKRQYENGLKIAKYLQSHPKIEKIFYPLLETSGTNKEIMEKQATGFTGMISFYIKSEDFDSLCEFSKDLKLFKFGTSLGGVDSYISFQGVDICKMKCIQLSVTVLVSIWAQYQKEVSVFIIKQVELQHRLLFTINILTTSTNIMQFYFPKLKRGDTIFAQRKAMLRMKKCTNTCKSSFGELDLYGHEVKLTYKGKESFSTMPGTIVSIVIQNITIITIKWKIYQYHLIMKRYSLFCDNRNITGFLRFQTVHPHQPNQPKHFLTVFPEEPPGRRGIPPL